MKVRALSILALFLFVTACSSNEEELITGIWHLSDWNPQVEEAEEFTQFEEDGSFYGYQKVGDMEAELFGSFSIHERQLTLQTDSMVARQLSTGEKNIRTDFQTREAQIDVLDDEWLVMTWTDNQQKYRLQR